MARIGVQAMMLKDSVAEIGAFETLRRVSEIGYRAIEVSQIPMVEANVAQLERARDELGIEVAALSAGLTASPGGNDSLEDDLDKIVADSRRLGTEMVRIGMLPFDAMGSLERVLDFCDRTDAYARRLAESGIRLYYHNHHVEFARFDGRLMLDIIADRAPNVGLELDVHWLQRGGVNPVSVIEQYAGRVRMVHLKDYRIGRMPDSAFESLAKGDIAGFMTAFGGVVQFGEVGEGNLDFAAIIPASIASGAEYLLVEQDDLYGRTVWDALQTSHDNLVALGFADLF
ncbi:sugar phosphate isomerase/epimerase [Microbacterium sp. SS28]|uniref:sugar phosphate isomerase/epimerase family protein n=1 Tax=Microbacterium sp. SS28 TaxID=2919948 RepID=UPI001FA98FBB|nr:sugar phosphate isomerase/epimerase [Microbacterium sp. SS28]